MRFGLILFLFCLPTCLAADEAKEKAEVAREMQLLEGTWKIAAVVQSGQENIDEGLGDTLAFKDGKISHCGSQADNEPVTFEFRLFPTSTPKGIDVDISSQKFSDAEKVVEGVYRLEGDTLTLCINWQNGPVKGNRPSAIESKEGTTVRLVTLKRQPK